MKRVADPTAENEPANQDLDPDGREVTDLKARLDDVLRAYSRLQQDKDDFRRRAEREKQRVLEIEKAHVAQVLLDAVDQLDLTLGSAPHASPKGVRSSCKDCDAMARGVQMIRDGLLRKIEQSGMVRLSTVGEPFDPNLHEAVETLPVADPSLDGRVVAEARAGYRHGERVLRPAQVSVGKFTPGGKN